MAIKRLTISGFRGILAPLELDFGSGGRPRSMIVYGRNGTGKSSLTDAWEWCHSETIRHLAREGAGQAAYPHRAATDAQSFVEIEFADPALGVVRQGYDHDRITKPRVSGNLEAFRQRTPHPCHIRFADLNRFVYLTKSERYDLLAQLMGFEPQVAYQKALRRVQRELRRDLDSSRTRLSEAGTALKGLLGLPDITAKSVTEVILDGLARHGIAADGTWETVNAGIGQLKRRVEEDPNAQRLADLRDLGSKLKVVRFSQELLAALEAYLALVRPFKDEEDTFKRVLLLAIYEKGAEVLEQEGGEGTCPLCGQVYQGNLRAHVAAELAKLRELKSSYDALEEARQTALGRVTAALPDLEPLEEAVSRLKAQDLFPALPGLLARLTELRRIGDELMQFLARKSEALEKSAVAEIRNLIGALRDLVQAYAVEHAGVIEALAVKVRQLQADPARTRLVDDYSKAQRGAEDWEKLQIQIRRWRALQGVYRNYSAIVQQYIEESLKDVASRFDEISANVATYFAILEEHTDGIRRPVLNILTDQDRSVILEIEFHGKNASPAHKYLSESQLNSFGLAVFLASAKRFNPNFKFLLLDDVVNSLDGYKHPQLIAVLKRFFSDYQILLLTHDSVWRDRVHRELPHWRRVHFRRHEFGIGPLHGEDQRMLDEIEQLIRDDKARLAGQALGPYMETVLQDVCESFEVEVKYNQRNEYTLEPLLDRLRVRLEKKLGAAHPLTAVINDLRNEMGFRNLCAHSKNPEIELTPQEMRIVVAKWHELETQLRCQIDACREVLRWTEPTFSCPCGASELVKVKAT